MFFQKEIETMNRRDLEELQLKRLKKMVDYCYNNVPFYHERLRPGGDYRGQNQMSLRYPVYPVHHKGRHP